MNIQSEIAYLARDIADKTKQIQAWTNVDAELLQETMDDITSINERRDGLTWSYVTTQYNWETDTIDIRVNVDLDESQYDGHLDSIYIDSADHKNLRLITDTIENGFRVHYTIDVAIPDHARETLRDIGKLVENTDTYETMVCG